MLSPYTRRSEAITAVLEKPKDRDSPSPVSARTPQLHPGGSPVDASQAQGRAGKPSRDSGQGRGGMEPTAREDARGITAPGARATIHQPAAATRRIRPPGVAKLRGLCADGQFRNGGRKCNVDCRGLPFWGTAAPALYVTRPRGAARPGARSVYRRERYDSFHQEMPPGEIAGAVALRDAHTSMHWLSRRAPRAAHRGMIAEQRSQRDGVEARADPAGTLSGAGWADSRPGRGSDRGRPKPGTPGWVWIRPVQSIMYSTGGSCLHGQAGRGGVRLGGRQ
ncbi:unnamed protein product [Pleuronectes platessa]|uniref:Uncharacterized protein n=1 Tax=Pleuronectes platessa TaxID=8262 RepID=A0A9N7ZDQ3_PLEPL|nr:unnamed protein product [Pleuronectes platessa]